jgi:hypothetical protein
LALFGGVPLDVASEFFCPKCFTRLRHRRTIAIAMSMPKAAMNEDDLPQSGKNQIRRSWQIATVEAKAIT